MVELKSLTTVELSLLHGAGITDHVIMAIGEQDVKSIVNVLAPAAERRAHSAWSTGGREPKMKEVKCPKCGTYHLSSRDDTTGCLLCGGKGTSSEIKVAPHVHASPWDKVLRGAC